MKDEYAHEHQHPPIVRSADGLARAERVYWALLIISAIIFGFDIWGHYQTLSFSLLSDAFHIAADKLSMIGSIFVVRMMTKVLGQVEQERKWEKVGALINAVCLYLVAIFIAEEILRDRLWSPRAIMFPWLMLAIAAIGVAGNFGQKIIMARVPLTERDLVHRGQHLHVDFDYRQNIYILAGAFVIGAAQLVLANQIFSTNLFSYFLHGSMRALADYTDIALSAYLAWRMFREGYHLQRDALALSKGT